MLKHVNVVCTICIFCWTSAFSWLFASIVFYMPTIVTRKTNTSNHLIEFLFSASSFLFVTKKTILICTETFPGECVQENVIALTEKYLIITCSNDYPVYLITNPVANLICCSNYCFHAFYRLERMSHFSWKRRKLFVELYLITHQFLFQYPTINFLFLLD